MEKRVVQVPVSLLLDPGYTAAAKVVWMAMRLHPKVGAAELQRSTGLCRQTVLNVTGRVTAGGGARVKVPADLLADSTVGATAKALYGLLQTTANFRGSVGQFTYTSLCAHTQFGRNTLRRAIDALVRAGWLQVRQESRLSPIHFTLGSPERARSQAEAGAAARRLKRAKFGGEAMMQEYLSLLIDSDQFTENARPGFLVNPLTGERLELDRFYPPNLAFEYNGAQHYRSTDRFSQTQANSQHVRDVIKAGICAYMGIDLVIIHPEHLSLQGMTSQIGRHMPLRNLAGHEPLIDLLEDASLVYRAAAGAAR